MVAAQLALLTSVAFTTSLIAYIFTFTHFGQ
jgi:hypothetical protein